MKVIFKKKKYRKGILFSMLFICFLISLVFAATEGRVVYTSGVSAVNVTTVNVIVNASDLWDSLDTPTDIDLNDLGDVNAGAPADQDALTWDDGSSKWIPQAIAALSKWVVSLTNGYLYNNSNTLYFNDTRLNLTIDSRMGAGANASWNQTKANSLYLSDGNYSILTGLISNASYLSTYNATYAAGSNASWNQTKANNLYAPNTTFGIQQLINNSLNSTEYWDNYNTTNQTQMENSGGVLNILVSWLIGLFYTKAEVDNNLSLYILDSSLPLENQTISHCSNITGNSTDLCTITSGAGGGADGNASSICSNNEVLLGDGSCYDLGHIQNSTNVTNHSIYTQLSDLNNQVFVATNTPQAINLTTEDEIYGLVHSTTTNNSQITIVTSGVYAILAQPQVTAGAGDAGDFHMWLEKHNTTQWVNVSNSNVELDLASNDQDVILLAVVISLKANEKIRVMGSVSDTGITLETISPAGEPVIPSIIFSMFITGPTEFTDTDTTYSNLSEFDWDSNFNTTFDGRDAISNNTLATWVDSLFIRFTEVVGLVGNWTLDKVNYLTGTEVNNTIKLEGLVLGFNSTYNATYDSNIDTNESDQIYNMNASWLSTFNQTYLGCVSNASYLSTYNATYTGYSTNLSEDEVEAYIFDNDNTANLNMSHYNITGVDYIRLNDVGGACDLSVNGSICMNATGTYIVG